MSVITAWPQISFEIAVPRVDAPTFVRQVELASAIWAAREQADRA